MTYAIVGISFDGTERRRCIHPPHELSPETRMDHIIHPGVDDSDVHSRTRQAQFIPYALAVHLARPDPDRLRGYVQDRMQHRSVFYTDHVAQKQHFLHLCLGHVLQNEHIDIFGYETRVQSQFRELIQVASNYPPVVIHEDIEYSICIAGQ